MTASPLPRAVRTRLWQWERGAGLERFELRRAEDGWLLRGTIVAGSGGGSAEVRYEVTCDGGWRTRRAEVAVRDDAGARAIEIVASGAGWWSNGREVELVRGCVDIDLGWSPSTNTLPIRRLGLAVGSASGPIVAAWVRFPELTLEPLAQEYRRLSERSYRYTSNGGAFAADLEVDDEGLVIDYPGAWRRVVAG